MNFIAVGNSLEQDSLCVLETIGIYQFRPGFWVGAGVGYRNGERTIVNDIPRDTRQQNWRVPAAVAYPITPNHGISVTYGGGKANGAAPISTPSRSIANSPGAVTESANPWPVARNA